MSKALYICYFGVREPLVQTQVIPYLLEIAKDGVGISLLTFEPAMRVRDSGTVGQWDSGTEFERIRRELSEKGIEWHWLPYHKRLSVIATAFDVFQGVRMIRRLMGRERFDILHARVHIPMLMAALAHRLSRQKPKLLFDIRGFFPEEYTDAGIWKEDGMLYRSVKRVEKWLMKEADGFVVLTEKARQILFPESANGVDKLGRPVEVIPCCVSLERFAAAKDGSAAIANKLGTNGRFVVTYVGSFGGWYLTQETADFFKAIRDRRSDAFALILTQSKREMIEPLLLNAGYSEDDYW
ncbi:MAG TPA: glycosyltransferase, partial [Pyrinomonadaceae bacterium]|nr:glycosyltransferase [Pyrinomonadaceae bacterium]